VTAREPRCGRGSFVGQWLSAATIIVSLFGVSLRSTDAFPVNGKQTVLPVGTEFNEDALDVPREVFKSEVLTGRKSYLIDLGDLAFSSPSILGSVARQAGISCSTCHVNGASNAKFYMPGASTRPGNFDTTGPFFNSKADNGVLDPVTIPSLRGARFLAPYGHDGRMASLRDFIRNVIVNEFSGPEPSPEILDAMATYIQDIDFLPNPSLGAGGKLTAQASAAEHRGEALFAKPFPRDPKMSCAACHIPSGAFVDHLQHDIGTGGLFKTPTLINADFNAPYFHDGRYNTYDQVVAYFDQTFDLELSPQDQKDLVAYLTAIGDGIQAYEHDGVAAVLKEINDFASVLDTAIPAHNEPIISLAVDTVGGELRELTEEFPDRKDPSVTGGKEERKLARTALKESVLDLRRVDLAASNGQFDDANAAYQDYRKLMAGAVPTALYNAEAWSLLNPKTHDAHYAALRQMVQTATASTRTDSNAAH
jgi:mono/diheme cytochrome c family protein